MPDGTPIVATTSAAMAECGCDAAAPGLLPVARAREMLLRDAGPVAGTESLPLARAAGRILAAPAHAAADLPPFDQSAMDGYGLTAEDLRPGAAPPRLVGHVAAGDPAGSALRPGEAVRLLTGARLPPGVAAVVMQEDAAPAADGCLLLRRTPPPGGNLRRCGEDVARDQPLLAAGTRLDARHLALLAASGVGTVAARRRVRVALLSNGSELRAEAAAGGGDGAAAAVKDSNRPMLLAMLRAAPEIACTDLGLLADDPVPLAEALVAAAATHDLILSTGGVSGSEADHMPRALRLAGGEAVAWKLALKPGKPLAHGVLGAARCLFLPGNPLAALVGMLVFGRPLLARLAGVAAAEPIAPPEAVMAEGFDRAAGREEFLPARIEGHDRTRGLPRILRAGSGGSARLLPLSRADGLLWLPAAVERVREGDRVRFHPFATGFGL